MENTTTRKRTQHYTQNPQHSKYICWKKESIRTLYRNRLKGKLTLLTGEIDTDWLKIKEAITKAAEEIIGYKNGKTGNGFGHGMKKYDGQ